ncbi:hypothetical protein [Nocardia cyriacigeorgica]|uniref:hypothetical protein n=1 Tax=Nocardia cyriacigeorgica TaxID=135487 RepID=UPI0018933B5B|nr:hypothetical protein [Nocardia cyriacigeorgica]MBF6287122.1 hypothetical protein [Nocardia cyriacigeorgica]BDU06450.1 hypothetical protein FMUBM48_27130 [Nocardia cyriacigeorgica]
MERLPYIDEHARSVDANRDRTWKALLKVVCKDPADPSTVPGGFALEEADPPRRLALAGHHPFSRYSLTFELDDDGPRHTVVRAITRAEFPGLGGSIYRALMIGTGGHKLVVRRMLARIVAAA